VASPVPANGYRTISPAEANKRLATEAGIVLLDVRTQGEHEAKSIPGSVLLPIEPVNMVGPNIGTLVPDKTTPIFIYCRSGRRSVDAAKILVKAGYVRVFDLGGINSWPYETVGADVRR
jgi:Rhodanese-related sulfurtransferase